MASLARKGGPHSGRVHRAWFDGARDKGDLEDAKRTAVDAMAGPTGAGDRAALAERLAALAQQVGDDTTVVEARRTAWTSALNLQRLFAVVHAARCAGVEAETLAALGEDAQSRAQPPSVHLSLATRVALLVFAGRLGDAVDLTEATDATGPSHSRPSRADEIVVPVLLVAPADASRHHRFDALVLASMLRQADDRIALSRAYPLVAHPGDPDPAPGPDPPSPSGTSSPRPWVT